MASVTIPDLSRPEVAGASSTTADSAFGTALKRVLKNISIPEERKKELFEYYRDGPESIFESLSNLDERHRQSSRTRRVFEGFNRFFKPWLEDFLKIAGTVAANNWEASLGIGMMSAVLVIAARVGEKYEKVMNPATKLAALFQSLRIFAENPSGNTVIEENLVNIYSALLKFFIKARELYVNENGDLKKTLVWPWRRKKSPIAADLEDLIATVEDLTSTLQLNAQAYTHINVEKSRIDQKESKKIKDEEDFMKMLKFVDLERFWDQLNQKRVDGTCVWTFNGHYPVLVNWKNEEQPQFVMLHGEAGVGKTVVSSYIRRALLQASEGSQNINPYSILVSTFSWEYNDPGIAEEALPPRTLLFEMCNQQQSAIDSAVEIFTSFSPRPNVSLPTEKVWKIMNEVAKKKLFDRLYVVLDAIDKCEETAREDLLRRLADLSRACGLKILLTCRTANRDQIGLAQIEGLDVKSAIQKDIEIIVRSRISNLSGSRSNFLAVKDQERLAAKLLQKAQGCGLWVHLVLETLEKSTSASKKDLEKLVDSAPSGLNEFYLTELKKINQTPEKNKAAQLLTILLGARRPLTLAEIRHVYALSGDPETPQNLEEDECQPMGYIETHIQRLLGTLVHIEDSNVSLIHQSLKDLLLRLKDIKPGIEGITKQDLSNIKRTFARTRGEANFELAERSIRYLTLFKDETTIDSEHVERKDTQDSLPSVGVFDDDISETISEVVEPSSEAPFARYASMYWPSHLSESPEGRASEIIGKALALSKRFDNKPPSWTTYYMLQSDIQSGFVSFPDDEDISPLVVAAYFGHTVAIDTCLLNPTELQVTSYQIQKACNWAATRNRVASLQRLAEHSLQNDQVHVNLSESLCWAANEGQREAVKLLSRPKYNVDINWVLPSHGCPLKLAVRNDHREVAELFLEDPRLLDSSLNFLILEVQQMRTDSTTSTSDHELLKKLVLDSRIDISATDKRGRTLLHFAAESGDCLAVYILLDTGDQQRSKLLNVPARKDLGSPVWYAARWGHTKVLEVMNSFTDIIALVKAPGEEGENAIAVASKYGRPDTLRFLIELDPEGVDYRDNVQRTPLSLTAIASDPKGAKVAEILLDTQRVDINSRSETGRTPLAYAVADARLNLIKTLVRRGADIDEVLDVSDPKSPKLLVDLPLATQIGPVLSTLIGVLNENK